MASPKDIKIGIYSGQDTEGNAATVHVYRSGRGYSIQYDGKSHHCHPSITDIDLVRREIYHVFYVDTPTFEPV